MEYSYLKNVKYLKDYKIRCEFEDGSSGIFDLSVYLNRSGVFQKLIDEEFAKKITLINGVITWGDGLIDIAPETIYNQVTHKPLPDWVVE